MGALVEDHYNAELENGGVGLGDCIDLGVEDEPETLAIEESVKILLQGLGEDVNREGLRKTPFRVAKALREGTKGYRQKVNDVVHGALFPEVGLGAGVGHAGGAGGLVIVRDIDLFSYCESCLLPFHIKCHVGYVPSEQRVVGLSKLSRVADIFAKRLQNPQHLSDQVCAALQQAFNPTGVALLLQCSHIHIHHGWVKVLVTSGSGVFEDEKANVWTDFLGLLRLRGICSDTKDIERPFCPSLFSCKTLPPVNSVMTNAVGSILLSLGEDPFRKELLGTPSRFVKWFADFKNSDLEMKKPFGGFVRCGSDSKPEMVSELNLPFWSQCEHHLLPFYGVVHIGYLCGSNGGGGGGGAKSTLQSIVHFHGYKLQVQERLTRQIAESVASAMGEEDVIVIVEASHTCMISRGIEKVGSNTATVAVLGRFSREPAMRMQFLQSIPNSCGLKENGNTSFSP
ncbi:unnamed protein product [Cuscuta campestris]|uniref:GTP cyclohydrolase 1 n=1 Tax=Cuscuta campestris TaxID=132261 RepID=A0A484NJE9_9ASTE|nr:unnamed protein product [Cuscuta campestris]